MSLKHPKPWVKGTIKPEVIAYLKEHKGMVTGEEELKDNNKRRNMKKFIARFKV